MCTCYIHRGLPCMTWLWLLSCQARPKPASGHVIWLGLWLEARPCTTLVARRYVNDKWSLSDDWAKRDGSQEDKSPM